MAEETPDRREDDIPEEGKIVEERVEKREVYPEENRTDRKSSRGLLWGILGILAFLILVFFLWSILSALI